jgi:hypothetical protein
MVSTIKWESEIDLKKSMEVTLQTLESQGAQNMIVKQEDFETEERFGLKSYGRFRDLTLILKTVKSCIMKLFSQEGLQQIMIFHEEGDTYANEISDRVLLCRINTSK